MRASSRGQGLELYSRKRRGGCLDMIVLGVEARVGT